MLIKVKLSRGVLVSLAVYTILLILIILNFLGKRIFDLPLKTVLGLSMTSLVAPAWVVGRLILAYLVISIIPSKWGLIVPTLLFYPIVVYGFVGSVVLISNHDFLGVILAIVQSAAFGLMLYFLLRTASVIIDHNKYHKSNYYLVRWGQSISGAVQQFWQPLVVWTAIWWVMDAVIQVK